MATTFRSKKNWPLGQGTLNTAIDDNDLTIVLDAGQGAAFPSSGQFTVTIDEEIILIDSRSTDTLTVNASGRGYDNSTASAHAAGVAIANYQIVKDFTDLETAVNGIENGTTTLAKVITSGTAANTHTIDDATTNTVVSVLELYKTSSGTPASGIGAKLLLGAEDSAGNSEAAVEIHGYLTTVTNASEQGAYLLRIKNSGSFMDALAITVASNAVTIGSNQLTATLWNTVVTTVNAFGAATTINIGPTTGNPVINLGVVSTGTVVTGATLRANSTTASLFNTVTTTLNFAGAATALNIGNASGATALAGTLDVSGTVSFGNNASISTTIAVQCDHLYSTTSGTLRGANFACSLNPSGASSAVNYGLQARTVFATAQNFTGISAAVNAITTLSQAGTVSRAHGVIAEVIKNVGTITDYRGLYVYDTASGTTITTAYGIYLDELGAGTTEYGLYIADLNDAGTNYAIYTNAGAIRFGDSITIADAKNIIFDTTTGTKIGTATTQKIGFWNVTPIVQPASANQAALSLDVDVTGGDTVDKAAINTNFTSIQTLVNQLRSDLVAAGLIKGAA